jgi:hypothetical protein
MLENSIQRIVIESHALTMVGEVDKDIVLTCAVEHFTASNTMHTCGVTLENLQSKFFRSLTRRRKKEILKVDIVSCGPRGKIRIED